MLAPEITTLASVNRFTALPGSHCVTASFHKVYAGHACDISEEMLLGLGAGVGFMYWHQKGQPPFLGGRANFEDFHLDLSRRTGVAIQKHATSSPQVAERKLLSLLAAGEPVMVYADMAFLDYLGLPEDAHFGGHAVVVCGVDLPNRQVLISDIAPRQTGVKDHCYGVVSLDRLAQARGSKFRPFPPGNTWFTFDFSQAHTVMAEDVTAAIRQCARGMLNAPIKNIGVTGLKTASIRASQWPRTMDEAALRMALWNVYVYTEIGGSGGGLFRFMYARFLEEAAALTGKTDYAVAARQMQVCAESWRALASPLKDVLEDGSTLDMCQQVSHDLLDLHRAEGAVWQMLAEHA